MKQMTIVQLLIHIVYLGVMLGFMIPAGRYFLTPNAQETLGLYLANAAAAAAFLMSLSLLYRLVRSVRAIFTKRLPGALDE